MNMAKWIKANSLVKCKKNIQRNTSIRRNNMPSLNPKNIRQMSNEE
jgi:hypothetical protein